MEPEDIDLGSATLWLIRGGESNRLVRRFLDEGVTGVGFGDLPDGRTVDAFVLQKKLAAAFVEKPEQVSTQFFSFVNRVEVGDVVFMPDPQAKGLATGIVTGEYTYDPDIPVEECRHRRSVDWRRRIGYDALPERLANLPKQRAVVADVPDGRLRVLAHEAFLHELGEDPHRRPVRSTGGGGGSRPRRSSTGGRIKKPAPKPVEQRRCMTCMMQKPLDFFDGDDQHCRDCME